MLVLYGDGNSVDKICDINSSFTCFELICLRAYNLFVSWLHFVTVHECNSQLGAVAITAFCVRASDIQSECGTVLRVHAVQNKTPGQTSSRQCLRYGHSVPVDTVENDLKCRTWYVIISNMPNVWYDKREGLWCVLRMALCKSGIGVWRHPPNSRCPLLTCLWLCLIFSLRGQHASHETGNSLYHIADIRQASRQLCYNGAIKIPERSDCLYCGSDTTKRRFGRWHMHNDIIDNRTKIARPQSTMATPWGHINMVEYVEVLSGITRSNSLPG